MWFFCFYIGCRKAIWDHQSHHEDEKKLDNQQSRALLFETIWQLRSQGNLMMCRKPTLLLGKKRRMVNSQLGEWTIATTIVNSIFCRGERGGRSPINIGKKKETFTEYLKISMWAGTISVTEPSHKESLCQLFPWAFGWMFVKRLKQASPTSRPWASTGSCPVNN